MPNFSAITTQNKYTYGYSAIPLRVIDYDAINTEEYKYIVNILWNKKTAQSINIIQLNSNVYGKVDFSTDHKFELGDVIFLNQDSNEYTDYYTIVSVPSSTSIIIDIQIGGAVTGNVTISNVLKYKITPDPDTEIKLDLSNTIKDYVTQNLSDSNIIFNGDNTIFDYELLIGYEGRAVYNFDLSGKYFSPTNTVAFVATGLTATTQVQFEIGDDIIINQDLYSWNYTDNYFSGGLVGFTGTTNHYFSAGDTINITGQITNPQYNGLTTINSVSAKSIVVNKPYGVNTLTEPGTVFGVVFPEYNTTAKVVNKFYIPGVGVILETDVPWNGLYPFLKGTIKHSDGRLISSYNNLAISGLSAFNSYVNELNYDINGFDKYVIQNRNSELNNISTILYSNQMSAITEEQTYRIEASSKSWLLGHSYIAGHTTNAIYYWYDSSNQLLGISLLAATSFKDFYAPIGLNQVLNSSGRFDTVPLTGISNSIDNYYVAFSYGGSVRTNFIKFKLNDDCSRYEIYHLMWKDALGSWLTYPFKYLSQDSTDIDRKNYYQTPGNWFLGTFGYVSYGRGERTFFVRSRDKIKLNSGWINDYENFLIKDLMQSASVFVQHPDGTLVSCTIDNKQITFGKKENEQIYQYTLDVIVSNNEIRL